MLMKSWGRRVARGDLELSGPGHAQQLRTVRHSGGGGGRVR